MLIPSSYGALTGPKPTANTTQGPTSGQRQPNDIHPAPTSEDVEPQLVADQWELTDLKQSTSELVACGDVVLYESLEPAPDGRQLVAVDGTNGQLLYEIDIDRGFVLERQHGAVKSHCGRELLFGLRADGYIEAFDINTAYSRNSSEARSAASMWAWMALS